eukprot:COSAG02_NODE_340_length_24179_cov_6.401644_16_plen_121_part_00
MPPSPSAVAEGRTESESHAEATLARHASRAHLIIALRATTSASFSERAAAAAARAAPAARAPCNRAWDRCMLNAPKDAMTSSAHATSTLPWCAGACDGTRRERSRGPRVCGFYSRILPSG